MPLGSSQSRRDVMPSASTLLQGAAAVPEADASPTHPPLLPYTHHPSNHTHHPRRSKADAVDKEHDRQRVLIQITQNLATRIRNSHAFNLPTFFLPNDSNMDSGIPNAIEEVCMAVDKVGGGDGGWGLEGRCCCSCVHGGGQSAPGS